MADIIIGKRIEPDKMLIMEQHIAKIEQRLNDLETLHPELQPRKPIPTYKALLKWGFFILLVGLFLYGLYLFYLYE